MIASANNNEIITFKVGCSPSTVHVIIPKISVPNPNPINLIFQKNPKCSYDHNVAFQNINDNGIPINIIEDGFLNQSIFKNCPFN